MQVIVNDVGVFTGQRLAKCAPFPLDDSLRGVTPRGNALLFVLVQRELGILEHLVNDVIGHGMKPVELIVDGIVDWRDQVPIPQRHGRFSADQTYQHPPERLLYLLLLRGSERLRVALDLIDVVLASFAFARV